jgi:putative ABC transport system substrate-binding protein
MKCSFFQTRGEVLLFVPLTMLMLILTLSVLAVPFAADAQRPAKVARIGWLAMGAGPPSPNHKAFLHGLRELGWVEGQNIVMAYRWAEGRQERLPKLAAELVRLQVNVIVCGGGEPVILAAKQATTTIPIVMAVSAAPVETGLVASLARPGGNITGLSIQAPDAGAKRLELLKEAVPQASRVAVLWNASYPGKDLEWQETQRAARTLSIRLHSIEVRRPEDFDGAFAAIIRERPDALLTFSEPLANLHSRQIVGFAIQNQLPLMSETKAWAETGGLLTYGASLPGLARRAAYYVDRILKGATPADLPVEQPTQFELVINLKTAKALGLTIPSSLLLLADEVIQ